jgi:diadenylate cyclase
MEGIIAVLIHFWEYFHNVLDILLVAAVFYFAYNFLSQTRAISLLKGLVAIFIIWKIAAFLNLTTISWIIETIGTYVVIAVLILFQPELRRLITQFGQRNWLSAGNSEDIFQLDELVNAIISMSEEKIGSLIVIERNTGLRNYAESGVTINSGITEELIRTIFFPNTALHDGAIIIQEGKIAAAACYLPLSDSKQLKKNHGARHRAALGISEESDALVLVTSEETGGVSIMVNGKIFPKIKISDLKNMILYFMNPKTAYEVKYNVK